MPDLIDGEALREALSRTFASPDMGGLTTEIGGGEYWYAEDVLDVLEDQEDQPAVRCCLTPARWAPGRTPHRRLPPVDSSL